MNDRLNIQTTTNRYGYAKYGRNLRCEDFSCITCHYPVSCLSLVSGVHHRNHCPYCLWSRCLDLNTPGDRLSACKSAMQPVGLTLKHVNKKYAPQKSGELMLVHRCLTCGKVSINRLAVDDDPQAVLETFLASLTMDPSIRADLAQNKITTLQRADYYLLKTRLYGKN
jgi:hypothetical protein